jgi:hypothetical protein
MYRCSWRETSLLIVSEAGPFCACSALPNSVICGRARRRALVECAIIGLGKPLWRVRTLRANG